MSLNIYMQLSPGAGRSIVPTVSHRLFQLARFVVVSVAGFFVFLLFLYKVANPPGSMLMASEVLWGNEVEHVWVPLQAISPNLIRAVIVSEDGKFCRHRGVDWEAIGYAIDQAGLDGPRGASTISMQTVKNLFLWNSRSYLRKALEIPMTYAMELAWSKPRILEIYLNIAEWGPGVYGAEAAARYHFGKSAARLTADEAARLAAALPDPLSRDAGNPSHVAARAASRVRRWMDGNPAVRCVLPASRDVRNPNVGRAPARP
jgi:monofunctional biosynthetic peptidoglycan transglycosylase